MKKAAVIVFFTIALSAHGNSIIDWTVEKQEYLSHRLYTFAHRLDHKLLNLCTYFCDNNDTGSTTTDTGGTGEWFTELFEDGPFDPAYIQSCARVRSTMLYDHQKGTFDPSVSFSISLALPRFTDRLNLIIQNTEESTENRDFNNDVRNSIGLSYRMPTEQYVHTSLFAGVYSLDDPYGKVRLWYPYELGTWQNIVYEDIKYSWVNGFEEETGMLFDRIIDETTLFRVQLGLRNSQYIDDTTRKGDFYFAGVSLAQKFGDGSAYKTGVSTLGSYRPEITTDKYAVYTIYKQNIWKEWVYFEVEPRVEWEERYDFHPNYLILFSLEFYIGKGFTQRVFSGFER